MRRRLFPAWLLALPLLPLLAAPAVSGELLRYRRADGSIGFAGDAGQVPPGAVIVDRRASTHPAEPPASRTTPTPTLEQALSDVRRHCESRHDPGSLGFEDCLADQTRAAFQVQDARDSERPGSVAARLNDDCRRRFARRRPPNYRRLARCIEEAHDSYEQQVGVHPGRLDVDDDPVRTRPGDPRESKEGRLRTLRSDQERAARELARGRATWGPRYRKAEQELHTAEAKTQAIVDRMKRRGCRTDSLACGGLPAQLAEAREDEQKKRNYLTDGIVSECRLAGCQPGWLR